MQIVSLIQGLWVVTIILLFFVNLRRGLCLYVAYLILVPYMSINLGVKLQWNMVNVLLLLAYIIIRQKRIKNKHLVSFKPFFPFLFLFVAQLLEMPFQDGVPFDEAINSFRLNLMTYLILPFVIWNYSREDEKLCNQLRITVVICICIAFGYGLFLTTTGGLNPYQIAVMSANGEKWNAGYAEIGGGRMFGRISSVFGHPMTYGLFLGMALVYIYTIREYIKKYMQLVLLFGIIAAIFLCGIRSPIGAMFVTILVYLLLTHRTKTMLQVGVAGLVVYSIVIAVPDLNNYVGSIFSDDKSEVKGSSFEMRFEQLQGCFHEIRNNQLFGKGYGWTGYYHENYGDHPVILSFESLVYVVLCNSGYVGVVIWIVFLFKLFKNTVNIVSDREMFICSMCLVVYYLAYSTITGDYGYMKYLILFYTLILIERKKVNAIEKNNSL